MTTRTTALSGKTLGNTISVLGVETSAGYGDLASYLQGELAREATRRVTPSAQLAAPTETKTLEEKLYDTRAALKIATAQVAMHLTHKERVRLFGELDHLLDPSEWPEEQAMADRRSFGTYLRMLIHQHPPREPSLGLSHDGNLLAGWISGRDRLSLEFLPADGVRWALSRYVNDQRESAAGICALARLTAVLAAYEPEHWFGDGTKAGDQSP